MLTATFVLSTGRCGTQWLAEKLHQSYGAVLKVAHEPLHNDYCPRHMLGAGTPHALPAESARLVLEHIEGIEHCLETQSYVECGHPVWSTLPYLMERLAGRIQIIHLTRHPVPTALSWLTHWAYTPPLVPYLPEKVLLSPYDTGVAFPGYRDLWPTLTPYEKCLYYWAEVNAFGLQLAGRTAIPWLHLTAEEMFAEAGIRKVQQFLRLEERVEMAAAGHEVVDRFHYVSADLPDVTRLTAHPAFVEVATRLGYAVEWADLEGLRRRYLARSPKRAEHPPTSEGTSRPAA